MSNTPKSPATSQSNSAASAVGKKPASAHPAAAADATHPPTPAAKQNVKRPRKTGRNDEEKEKLLAEDAEKAQADEIAQIDSEVSAAIASGQAIPTTQSQAQDDQSDDHELPMWLQVGAVGAAGGVAWAVGSSKAKGEPEPEMLVVRGKVTAGPVAYASVMIYAFR